MQAEVYSEPSLGVIVYSLLKPFLFALNPEVAHDLTVKSLSHWGRIRGPRAPRNGHAVKIAGLTFANPIGLAAGLDKDGEAVSGFSTLGFGHIEVGTVTPKAQPGNAKPRVFRLREDEALINRFGFNNHGVDALVTRLHGHAYQGVLGVNIGKNKDTPNESAAEDYVHCLQKAAPVADYITVNVSSPNTPGLRDLADAHRILEVIHPVLAARELAVNRKGQRLPVFVKLAPDFADEDLVKVLNALADTGIDAVILTNTTLARDGLTSMHQTEAGGLSGAPLTARSAACLSLAVKTLDGRLPIISVGGIMTAHECQARLKAGASLVQLYTGLIYKGPGLVRKAIDESR